MNYKAWGKRGARQGEGLFPHAQNDVFEKKFGLDMCLTLGSLVSLFLE